MGNEYLQPCPLSWVHDVLKAKANRGERFTEQDAVQSLLLDRLRDVNRSKSAYARLWGWPRATLYDKWDELEEKMEAQRTFYRSRSSQNPDDEKPEEVSNPAVTRHPPDTPLDTEQASAPTNGETPTPVRHPSDTSSTPYITDPLDNTEKDLSTGTRARGDDPEVNHSDPVAAYKKITGHTCPIFFQELIRHKVGREPPDIELWQAVCHVWSDTPNWNARQVKKMINDFKQQQQDDEQASETETEDAQANRMRIIRAAAEGAGLAR